MATDPLAGQDRRALSLRAGRAPAPLHAPAYGEPELSRQPSEQLLLAPQDLRTADPSFATEIYNGHFGLAGSLVELGAQSPFEITPPSEGWARELYGFGWLRHLRVAGSELSREQAKALLGDFLKLHKTVRGLAWQPEVVARRVISWLSNSVVVLDAGDPSPTRPSCTRSRCNSAIFRRAIATRPTVRRVSSPSWRSSMPGCASPSSKPWSTAI